MDDAALSMARSSAVVNGSTDCSSRRGNPRYSTSRIGFPAMSFIRTARWRMRPRASRPVRSVRERLALESDGAPRGTLGLDEVLDAINGDGRDRELAKVRDEMPLGERAVVVQRARADRVERRVP